MIEPDRIMCDVCRENEAAGVCSSAFGPISSAYCKRCLEAGREVWPVMIGGLMGCRRGEVRKDLQPMITATCLFYEKTEDDMWSEIDRVTEEYAVHCQENNS